MFRGMIRLLRLMRSKWVVASNEERVGSMLWVNRSIWLGFIMSHTVVR
jgi:hypothetical protein